MFSWLTKIFKGKKNNLKHMSEIIDFEEEHAVWWGNFTVEDEQSRFWKIGNIIICLDRYNHEWHIAHYKDTNSTTHTPAAIPKEKFQFKTFASRQNHNEITLKPTLPNRSLLSQLERPLAIPAGEDILLYISSPAWIRIEVGKTNIILDEIPTRILSDTWLGKNTLEGELCYASLNHCSPHLEEIKVDNTRVLSPLFIINRSKEPLLLKELRVPLPYLSIYSDSKNHLWTEQLSIYYEGDQYPEATVKKIHKSLEELKLVTRPRSHINSGATLKKLFNPFTRK